MAKPKKTKPIKSYAHTDKERINNPPAGLVTAEGDPDLPETEYAHPPPQFEGPHDPHIDPELNWAGKAEGTSFTVPTVSLHVHERIDPCTIIEAARKRNGHPPGQESLFETEEENPPLRKAIEFYQHPHNWSNRLIAGDSLLVMNSLLEKEGYGGQVQMIYIDPPYGIKYGSNFQHFVDDQQVTDGKDNHLTAEPEMIKAFRDTWEIEIHSYLSYLRDRLLLARKLLTSSGSCFLQIGDENVHRVGLLMDEIFGAKNRVTTITFATTSGSSSKTLPDVGSYLIWYAKDKSQVKYQQIYEQLTRRNIIEHFNWHCFVELQDGTTRNLTDEERFNPDEYISEGARIYKRVDLTGQGRGTKERSQPYIWNDRKYKCPPNRHWSISHKDLDRLADLGRLDSISGTSERLMWRWYENEVPGRRINNLWANQMSAHGKKYVVETARKVIARCILMTTDPGDLVLDPTCGGGTTAVVAEQWGRRWITCDTSRVALTLARQRLLTSNFDYYKLVHPKEGVGSGFVYKTVPKVSAKILACDDPPQVTALYDQPIKNNKKSRVTGPFTMEAVPAPTVTPLSETQKSRPPPPSDESVSRSGESVRQVEWRDELLKTGLRGTGGNRIKLTRLEPLPLPALHAEGETDDGSRLAVSFGPEHAPLETRQVERAIEDARTLIPKPDLLVFAAFIFDPEAAKDIEETNWPGVTLLRAQMNADLLTSDLKKARSSNESFWLVGQPDVYLERTDDGQFLVEVLGFDYFDTRTGQVTSGGADKIAVWMLDPDYDGRSLFPRQVFFPLDGKKKNGGWNRLAQTLRAQIDQSRIEAYRGTVSLPFPAGEHRRVAVKVVDNRGVESLRLLSLDDRAS